MQAQKNGYTILVGEDELEVRGYLEIALKCLGYSVELAQDGEEVINYLRSSSRPAVSMVLLDLIMPQRDGMEVLREIRQIDPELPVIIVSGAASTLNIVTAMKSGATDFLCKPVAHEDLQKAIRSTGKPNSNSAGAVSDPFVRQDQGISRNQPADEGDPFVGSEYRLVRGSGFDSGRNRERQRSTSAGIAQQLSSFGQDLLETELRGAPLGAGGERTLRI